jgi:hypothetical protein
MIAVIRAAINPQHVWRHVAVTLNSRQPGAAGRSMEFNGDIKGL